MMNTPDLAKLKCRIKFLNVLYLMLFITSITLIAMHAINTIWAVALGAAALLRILVINPMQTQYSDAKAAQTRKERNEDLNKVIEAVKS